jgi:putative CRISPR-associated protein (TIGR02619 family)
MLFYSVSFFFLMPQTKPKFVICSTGTSIANRCPSSSTLHQESPGWNEDAGTIQTEINSRVDKFLRQDPPDLKATCAEMNSLNALKISKHDRVLLLASDSAFSRYCCDKLKLLIVDSFSLQSSQVEIRRIDGLQVHDPKLLRDKGLPRLVEAILEVVGNETYRNTHEILLNCTGGFKGIVPFLTILGMLYGCRTVYQFEHANNLISLPPLPFSFDLQVFERVKSALNMINEHGEIAEATYFGKIKDYHHSERELFLSYTEPTTDDKITLSPLAFLLLASDKQSDHLKVRNEVLETLEHLDNAPRQKLQMLMAKCTNHRWRASHSKTWGGDKSMDLTVIKPGNTAERLAGFLKDNVFHVTNIFSTHDQYERELGNYSVANFRTEIFQPWTPTQQIQDAVTDDIDKLRQQALDSAEALARAETVNEKHQLKILEQQEQIEQLVLKHQATIEKIESALSTGPISEPSENLASQDEQVPPLSLLKRIAQFFRRN